MADSTPTVTIGCKLPHGMILELGYQVTEKDKTGRDFLSVKKLPNYKRVRLNGWHEASGAGAITRAGLVPPPSALRPTSGITKNVPRDFWEAWKKAHPDMLKRLNGVIFEATDDVEAAAKAIDANQVPTGLEPLDPSKLPVRGIVKANFDE